MLLLDRLRIRTDIMNDKEKIKKAAMFIDSFLVRDLRSIVRPSKDTD